MSSMKNTCSMTVTELKDELRERGAPLRGKKADLVERLAAYRRNNNFTLDVPDNQSAEAPDFQVPPDGLIWKDVNASSILPPITRQHIQVYLEKFHKNIVTGEAMYKSGFLTFLRYCKEGQNYYLKGRCFAQMYKKVSYNGNIKLFSDGSIEAAHCECAAGSGGAANCKHVVAMLLGGAHIVEEGKIILRKACTESLQTFHHPSTSYYGTPIKASSIKRVGTHSTDFDPRPQKYRVLNVNERFHNLIASFPNSTMPLKQLSKPANPYAVEWDHIYSFSSGHPQFKFLKCNLLLEVTQEDIERIEIQTCGQHKNKMWHEYRHLRITASKFHDVCNVKSESASGNLAKTLLSPGETIRSDAMNHGILYESVAVSKLMQTLDPKFGKEKECGMFIFEDYPYLAASPDRLLGEVMVIEVKCPYSARNQIINEMTVPYLYMNSDGKLTLKESDPYYFQVQGQMAATKRRLCIFVVYTFCDLKAVIIERDDDFVKCMLQKLELFYKRYFLPALLQKYYYKSYSEYF